MSRPQTPIRPDTASRSWEVLPDRRQTSELLHDLRRQPSHRPLPNTAQPVVLYGAGELGQMAMDWCRQYGVAVHAVVDASAERWLGHRCWRDEPVYHPQNVPDAWRHSHRLLVCISTLPYAPLEQALKSQGWLDIQPFYDFAHAWPVRHPLNNGWHARLPREGAAAPLERVLHNWADDHSRAHHLQFLAWRCLRQEWRFDAAPVQPEQRYFIPEMQACWRPGERLLDGGAHHGQVLDRWIKARPGWLEQAWAIEPDPDNHALLARWWSDLPEAQRPRISLHDWALAKRSGRRSFVGGQGYGCRLWRSGGQRATAMPLDDLNWSPSFVKLHLEGSELLALQGAVHTLKRTRPLMALTVYHNRDGLYATADWLAQALPDYRWLFRLHGWLGTAAVIYGIPAERAA